MPHRRCTPKTARLYIMGLKVPHLRGNPTRNPTAHPQDNHCEMMRKMRCEMACKTMREMMLRKMPEMMLRHGVPLMR